MFIDYRRVEMWEKMNKPGCGYMNTAQAILFLKVTARGFHNFST